MSNNATLEERVAALERTIEQITAGRAMQGKPGWLKRMYGSMSDWPDFDEVVRLGAEWRRSQTYETEPETRELRERGMRDAS